ncbi:hypothetical protein [Cohnella sp. REN36]|uniref:hypothetical protein n=1 Tax=Cohnella sp. REN36 TaxID=2887347 RepID=UPI001D15D997|nr:hypothetical protein [Cohnella sp. REN36]MCC3377587.1 hypothetical protein [Cohnella sp. REN36]
MGKKKKKKPNTPRAKRMNRQGRLQSAVSWLKKYNGKQYIRGYSKHYGVDTGTAIVELRMLGISLSDEVVRRALASAAASLKARKDRKKKRQLRLQEQEPFSRLESDETFAVIVGYTNWGFPYGITWEEMELFADRDSLYNTVPPQTPLQYYTSVDEKGRPYVDEREAEEVPFDFETFIQYFAELA